LAAAIGFALVLVFGVLLWRESLALSSQVTDVRTIYDPASVQVATLDTALSDMQRGVSGFLISGSEADLRPYVNGARRSELSLGELQRLTADDAEASDLVAAMASALGVWIDDSTTPVIEARRAGDESSALAKFQDPAYQRNYAAIEAELARLRALVEERRREVFDRLARQSARLTISVAVVVTLLWAALMLGFLLAHRRMLAPLDDLRAQIRTATRVNNHATISGQGPPELRLVAADVEAMRRALVGEIDEARAAVQALDQKAPVVAAFRAELAPGQVVRQAGLSIHGELQPAEGVLAGDWWDTARLRATGEVAIILADVSGHGVPAALAAIRLKQAIALGLRQGADLAEMAASVASLFSGETWYATIVAVCIDPEDGAVRYINAGHPSPLLIDEHGAVVEELGRTALPLGVGRETDIGHIGLAPGQTILLFSDGLLESRDAQGEELGDERLRELLQQVPDDQRDPPSMVPWLLGAVRERAANWSNDDVTLVAVRRG